MADFRLAPDGIQARQQTKKELELLHEAKARLQQLRVPRLISSPRDRVYVAAMDGTGNDRSDALERRTIVAKLADDLRALGDPAIEVGYMPGVGTQDSFFANTIDGMGAVTFRARVEQSYLEFCRQAARWLNEGPEARIHMVGIGFSRGGEAVSALQRMVQERGIRNPMGVETLYGEDGILHRIDWDDHPLLVPPGRTVQIALLLDPVATSVRDHDRVPPSSNVSTLQFTSAHEPRKHFEATLHAPLGLSDGGRVANFLIGGAHSDIGGSYLLDGVGRHVHNMGVDYLNAALGEPLLQHVAVPYDPRMYVVHRSDQHKAAIWPTRNWRRDGERGMHTDLGPACRETASETCLRDPVDHGLASELEWRYVERGRSPGPTDPKMEMALAAIDRMYERFPTWLDRAMANSPGLGPAQVLAARDGIRDMFGRLAEAAGERNDFAMSVVVNAYMATPHGQLLRPGYIASKLWLSQGQAPPVQEQAAIPALQP